ncbi:hypothetical protein QFC22_006288 [Naganishia vaughanmartiniae]|uniref:Uncharacterized protein n=1 Tax=Naganishia vaughanmartiniae TaxID=1424756 RepID=A0ACC2WN66_9TREE|nr:hypothetical protein QFC22_006288 [Naganishia vaughanmartiniae]
MPSQRTIQRATQRATQRRIISPVSADDNEIDELASSQHSSSDDELESGDDDDDEEDEQEWEALAILDERTIPDPSHTRSRRAASSSNSSRSKPVPTITQYLIDWVGTDPKTGKHWAPSWENAQGATEGLVEEWKARKAVDPGLVGRYMKVQEEKKKQEKAAKRKGKSVDKQPSSVKKPTSARTTPAKRREAASTTVAPPLPFTKTAPETSTAAATTSTTGKRKRSPSTKTPAPTSPSIPTTTATNTSLENGSERRRTKKQKTSGTLLQANENIDRFAAGAGVSPRTIKKSSTYNTNNTNAVSVELPVPPLETAEVARPRESSRSARTHRVSQKPQPQPLPTQQQTTLPTLHQSTQPAHQHEQQQQQQHQSPSSVVEDSQPPLPVTSSDERSAIGATPASASGSFVTPQAAALHPAAGSPSASSSRSTGAVPTNASTSTRGTKGAPRPGAAYIASPLNKSTPAKRVLSVESPAQTAASRTTTADGLAQNDSLLVTEQLREPTSIRPHPPTAQTAISPPTSLDISASQADALSRALDLLMEEEDFLETAEAIHHSNANVNASVNGNAVAGPSNSNATDNDETREAADGEVDEADVRSVSEKPEAGSTENAEREVERNLQRTKQHYPIPQVTPSAFRQFGQQEQGASTSFNDTQPDSIADFEDSMVRPSHQRATKTTTTQAEIHATEIIPPAAQAHAEQDTSAAHAPAVIGQADVEMVVDMEMEVEDDSESFVPVLGEENWSRILNSSTIDPAMLGKPPGVLDEGNSTSSDDDSQRSGSHVATRQVQVEMHEQDDFVAHAARISALENELAREREEKRHLEDESDDKRRQLEEEKRHLQNDLEAMTREHKSTQEQYSLMQDLYTRASETTMRLNRQNEELREENEKMSTQLGVGLKQKDLFYQSILDAKDHELAETRAQRDLLVEQASRTGDIIREKAGRLPLVEAERNDALARIAACPLCSKLATESDEDSDYNPTQEDPIVPDYSRARRTCRNQAPEATHVPEVPEKRLHDGASRLHASPGEWEQYRKQYPVNSVERWVRPPNLLFPPVKPAMEKHFDLDIDSFSMVYMCRWRPAHGNACGALFANRKNLAEHAVEHFNDDIDK